MTTNYAQNHSTSQLIKIFNSINNLNSSDIKKFISLHKSYESKKERHKSSLYFKIKKNSIKKTNFGINITISNENIQKYLNNGHIIGIKLNFSLNNLSKERNTLFIFNDKKEKELISYFKTHDNHKNIINLDNYISEIHNKIAQNKKICFYIPIFNTYDNYDDFYKAISNVSIKIDYLERSTI